MSKDVTDARDKVGRDKLVSVLLDHAAPVNLLAYSAAGGAPPKDEHSGSPAPFPLSCLPPAAEAMARAVGEAVRVPPGLAGPVALGILASCIGAGLEIQSGPGRTSRANLFILASAASGSGKSEALRLLAAPLHAREQAALVVRHG